MTLRLVIGVAVFAFGAYLTRRVDVSFGTAATGVALAAAGFILVWSVLP